ncbi:unnamed protein product, partial [Closterium sp. NIES-54]
RTEFGDEAERPRWAELLRSGVDILDLEYDAILAAMYALSVGAEGDCYLCVPPDPDIEAAALGASESALPADPSGGPVAARSSTVLSCLAVLSGSLSGLQLPSFSTNLVSTAALQDAMVTTTTPWGQRVSICMCTRTGRHLATFTRRPGSSLYTRATKPPQVGATAQVSVLGPVATPCSCRLLSHLTLLWHHRLGHPSLPRLRGMHSRFLVPCFPRSLPPLPPSLAPPFLPCAEGRQRTAPHSSFLPTTAPLQTLHMDDLPVLRLHSNRGGEFSSDLLREFCRGEGSLHSITLSASLQQNGIAECRIGLVIEVARTSMIHAAAPHFLWPFAFRYATHQLNLWPRVSLPETSPTLCWTGKVGDASVFRVWGSCAFVRDMSADKLSTHAIPRVFLGFPPNAPGWQFYHPTSRHVLPSEDVTFDESVPFYHLFPYRSAPLPPLPLFLAPRPPPVDPLPPQGPAPSGVSQVDPLPSTVPVEVAVDSGAARGAGSGGAESTGAEPGGAESEGAGSGGAEPAGAEPWGAEPEGAEPGGTKYEGAESGDAEPRGTASSRGPTAAGAGDSATRGTGAGGTGATSLGGAGVLAGAGGPGGAGAAGHGGPCTRGTGASGAAIDPGAGGAGAGGATSGGTGAAGVGAGDPGAGDTRAGGAGPGGAVAVGAGAGDTGQPRLYFVPLLQQVLGLPSSTGLTPPLLCPPPDQSQPPLQPASPLPAPSPYIEQTGGLTERREPVSRPASPVRSIRTSRRVPRRCPPLVPCTHHMALRPSFVPQRIPTPSPPASSLADGPDHESNLVRAASPTAPRLLAIVVTDPSFESAVASALVAELVDFAAAHSLDYTTSLVAESESDCPPSVEVARHTEDDARGSWAPRPLGLSATATAATATTAATADIAATAATAATAAVRTAPLWLRFEFSRSIMRVDQFILTIEDLASHLRTSDACYRAALSAEFLAGNPPPMYITLYFIVTRLPDSLRSIRDHFLSLDPTSLTVDLLEQHLLAAETSAVAVGAARGTPRPPFFEGCSPSPLAPSYASAAAAYVSVAEDVGAASTSAKRRSSKGKGGRGGGGGSGGGGGGSGSGGGGSSGGSRGSGGDGSGGSGGGSGGVGGGGGCSGGSGGSGSGGSGGGRTGAEHGGSRGGQRERQQRRSETPSPQQLREWLFQRGASVDSVSCPYVIRMGDRAGQTCVKAHTQHRCFSRLDDAWRAEFGDEAERPHWAELLRSGVAIFDLDNDAILSVMYALSASAEGDCYLCVPPDPGIEAAALGAGESSLPSSAPVEALHTFTLDSGASRCFFRDSTTLTPLPAPVPVRVADPSGGPIVARSSTVLPCPAVPSGSLSGLHLPSFSTNLVSTACQNVIFV